MNDNLQTLWQTADAPPPVPESLRDRAARLDRTLRWRDVRELAAVAVVALIFSVRAAVAPELPWGALGLVGLSLWIGGVILSVRLRFPRASPWMPLRDSLRAEHRWLSAQTALLRWAWLWYVLPITAGVVAFDLSDGHGRPVYLTVVGLLGAALSWANWKAADDLMTTRDAFAAHLHDLDHA